MLLTRVLIGQPQKQSSVTLNFLNEKSPCHVASRQNSLTICSVICDDVHRLFYLNLKLNNYMSMDVITCHSLQFTNTPCLENNGTTAFLPLTLTNASQFSKFFHQQT